MAWSNSNTTSPAAEGTSAIHTRRSNGANDTRYLTKDHLGASIPSPTSRAPVLARLSYDAFGRRRSVRPNALTVVNAVTHIAFSGREMLK
jgi:hypothetical protein